METPEPGDSLLEEYEVISTLGKGAFGHVLEVEWKWDAERPRRRFALKIVQMKYAEAAQNEIYILNKIGFMDQLDLSCCIKLYRSHVTNINGILTTYMLFEKLGIPLYSFQRMGGRFTYNQIRHIASQILTALAFLHENSIVHADLKQDNILFMESGFQKIGNGKKLMKKTDLQIIDFGVSFDMSLLPDDHVQLKLCQIRSLRAPEVFLKVGHGKPIDIWSFGCILFNIYQGKPLVHYKDDENVIFGCLEQIFGKFPKSLIEKSPIKDKFFDEDGQVKVDEEQNEYIRRGWKTFKEYPTEKTAETILVFDLMKKLLDLDPTTRITAEAALEHPYFTLA